MAPLSVSVVIPVKDGAAYLPEQLAALKAEGPDEILVIDSGSTDDGVEIARRNGVRTLEIAPAEFGHGRTRNLGAESTSGDVIAFLTQDATPEPGWLDGLRSGFDLADNVGAVFGPHRARADTSPMIARELDGFFASKGSRDGGPAVERAGGDPWLSNVNAAYRRDCWEQLRFEDVPYSEDQAFGRAMLAAGWSKVFAPAMSVLHAHDYPPAQFARRYFDEYRGLRETVGHIEPLSPVNAVGDVRGLVSADREWMREQGYETGDIRRWTARALLHHSSRKVFGALGSRAHVFPAPVQKRLSLEGTAISGAPAHDGPMRGEQIGKMLPQGMWETVRTLANQGPAPMIDPLPGQAIDRPLHIAAVIPPFKRGSGGHMSLFQLLIRLERTGHEISIWMDDETGLMKDHRPARIRREIRDWFVPLEAAVYKGFDDWFGADVALATGWQTAHSVALLPQTRARAYLVQDHEPEFYATSAESRWAEATYGLGFHHLCGSPWLEAMSGRYGGSTSRFSFGIEHDLYYPRAVTRRPDTVVLYGRDTTPRRAVPMAMLALEELVERRPATRIVSFGTEQPIYAPFPYEHLGVLSLDQLAWAFSEGTVGLVLSLTNYSVIPQEMLACGMPCVEVAGISGEGVFGEDGGVAFADFSPIAVADALERLLDDRAEWERRSAAGLNWAKGRTWDAAAEQVQAGLREALRLRTPAAAPGTAGRQP